MTRTISYSPTEYRQIATITGLVLIYTGNRDRSISARSINSDHDIQEKIKPLTEHQMLHTDA